MAKAPTSTSANLGFEDKLWAAADKLRGNMDASEYKHVVLGLVFLKYISDAFMEKFDHLSQETANPKSDYYVKEERARYGVAEDRDEYLADNIFWVPPEARWPYLQKNAKRPEIGTLVDDALAAIERDNKVLKGVLPKDYARPALDKARLGEIIDLIATIGLGDKQARERDVLGRVYDYILANPPFNMEDWGYSKVKNDVRWRRFDQPSGNAQFSLPPGGERKQKDGSSVHVDGGNANYAWILHFLHHLAPHGTAGFVLANGSLTSNTSGEGDIRKAIIEADMVDCIIALPGQLFYTTPIPACLWFITRDKRGQPSPGLRPPSPSGRGAGGEGYRDRRGEVLFIDARRLGVLTDRVHRELPDTDIVEIARTYHAWRGEQNAGKYEDQAGFCKAARLKEIDAHGHVLTPGRYVGAEEVEDDGVPFEEKMAELSSELYEQMTEGVALDTAIRKNLEALGYGE